MKQVRYLKMCPYANVFHTYLELETTVLIKWKGVPNENKLLYLTSTS